MSDGNELVRASNQIAEKNVRIMVGIVGQEIRLQRIKGDEPPIVAYPWNSGRRDRRTRPIGADVAESGCSRKCIANK